MERWVVHDYSSEGLIVYENESNDVQLRGEDIFLFRKDLLEFDSFQMEVNGVLIPLPAHLYGKSPQHVLLTSADFRRFYQEWGE